LEIVNYLAEGLTNREIAERLGLSRHTVKSYLLKVFDAFPKNAFWQTLVCLQ
jgi:DNA-binding CsgD family transcriptional regulator